MTRLRDPKRNHLIYSASDMMSKIGENLWSSILELYFDNIGVVTEGQTTIRGSQGQMRKLRRGMMVAAVMMSPMTKVFLRALYSSP